MKRKVLILAIACAVLILGGAVAWTVLGGKSEQKSEGEKNMSGYKCITMDEAKEIFKTPGDYIIVDVRRPDEFAEGHIPGAINIVNESIYGEPEKLPDKEQEIYIYCRSGRRSKEAAEKLSKLGYSNIIEFGGIIDWTGEKVK